MHDSISEVAREIHNAYLPFRHSRGVWCSPQAVAFLSVLLASQRCAGITGDMIEIGVANGGSAFLTIAALRPGEKQILIDKQRNVGFDEKLALLSEEKRQQITFLETRGHDAIGRFDVEAARFIHVDDGHLKENVRQDILDYVPYLAPEGVLCFDDFFETSWPGVTEAVIQTLPQTGVVPFALMGRKLCCCWASAHGGILDMLSSATESLALFGTPYSATASLLDSPTLILKLQPNPSTAKEQI